MFPFYFPVFGVGERVVVDDEEKGKYLDLQADHKNTTRCPRTPRRSSPRMELFEVSVTRQGKGNPSAVVQLGADTQHAISAVSVRHTNDSPLCIACSTSLLFTLALAVVAYVVDKLYLWAPRLWVIVVHVFLFAQGDCGYGTVVLPGGRLVRHSRTHAGV